MLHECFKISKSKGKILTFSIAKFLSRYQVEKNPQEHCLLLTAQCGNRTFKIVVRSYVTNTIFFCVHDNTTTDLCINALIFMKVVDIYIVLV